MANVKISELPAGAATLLPASVLPAVESSSTKKWTRREIIRFALAAALSGASHTLTLAHAWQRVPVSHSSTVTVTVPPNADVAFEIGDEIALYQSGVGQLVIAQGAGVTVTPATGATLKAKAQNSQIRLVKIATNTWLLDGDLETSIRIPAQEFSWGAFNYNNGTWINPNVKFAGNPANAEVEWLGVSEDCYVDRATVQVNAVSGGTAQLEWTLWRAPFDSASSLTTDDLAVTDMQVIRPANSPNRFFEVTIDPPLALAKGDCLAVKFTGGTSISGGPACEFRMRAFY